MGFYTKMIEIANQWVAETFDAPVIIVGKCPQAVPPLLSHLKPGQRERFKGMVLNPFVPRGSSPISRAGGRKTSRGNSRPGWRGRLG
jgi:cobyric acid synthase